MSQYSILSVWDYDVEEIARQLTLIDFESYSAIKPTELLNQKWSKKKLQDQAPNVLALIDRFSSLPKKIFS